ncbi:MAG: hypothetical protein IJS34_00970 [Alphaproteobacteria bacterium]|nr:hypothetical protein [Alphaproteobacteria bacterium]
MHKITLGSGLAMGGIEKIEPPISLLSLITGGCLIVYNLDKVLQASFLDTYLLYNLFL